ncbi:conjugal transfer protein TraF [Aeromonas hydrophila]|uniref:Conjugal transfer protein TraF n=1 Tax=Aeromonas hydrophila TaxID=644 RepID=A0A926FI56_AERHY|nr:conjugal transfer protein TraF [Aeromonas hydrophila]
MVFFFIYDTEVPSSAAYAPIVSDFANKWGIQIQAISRSGKALPTWPGEWKQDVSGNFQKRIGVASHPAPLLVLFERPLLNPQRFCILNRGGILAHDEIENVYLD